MVEHRVSPSFPGWLCPRSIHCPCAPLQSNTAASAGVCGHAWRQTMINTKRNVQCVRTHTVSCQQIDNLYKRSLDMRAHTQLFIAKATRQHIDIQCQTCIRAALQKKTSYAHMCRNTCSHHVRFNPINGGGRILDQTFEIRNENIAVKTSKNNADTQNTQSKRLSTRSTHA